MSIKRNSLKNKFLVTINFNPFPFIIITLLILWIPVIFSNYVFHNDVYFLMNDFPPTIHPELYHVLKLGRILDALTLQYFASFDLSFENFWILRFRNFYFIIIALYFIFKSLIKSNLNKLESGLIVFGVGLTPNLYLGLVWISNTTHILAFLFSSMAIYFSVNYIIESKYGVISLIQIFTLLLITTSLYPIYLIFYTLIFLLISLDFYQGVLFLKFKTFSLFCLMPLLILGVFLQRMYLSHYIINSIKTFHCTKWNYCTFPTWENKLYDISSPRISFIDFINFLVFWRDVFTIGNIFSLFFIPAMLVATLYLVGFGKVFLFFKNHFSLVFFFVLMFVSPLILNPFLHIYIDSDGYNLVATRMLVPFQILILSVIYILLIKFSRVKLFKKYLIYVVFSLLFIINFSLSISSTLYLNEELKYFASYSKNQQMVFESKNLEKFLWGDWKRTVSKHGLGNILLNIPDLTSHAKCKVPLFCK
jgi:hypothetical protein